MGGQGDALGDQSYSGAAIVVSVSDLSIAEAFSFDRLCTRDERDGDCSNSGTVSLNQSLAFSAR